MSESTADNSVPAGVNSSDNLAPAASDTTSSDSTTQSVDTTKQDKKEKRKDKIQQRTDDDGTKVTEYPDGTVRRENVVAEPTLTPSLFISVNAATFAAMITELQSLTTMISAVSGSSALTTVASLPDGGNSSLTYQLVNNN